MSGEPVVTATGVTVRRGRQEVLHEVSITAHAGEVVALLGPNGAGKSTLVNALGGVLKIAGGRIERHGRVATMMQSPGLARRSARANVVLATAWWGVPRGQRGRRADEALQRMRAGHLSARSALTLSGGEQRRVHLARALAVAPELLLLDEPFDGLDPHTHEAIRDDLTPALRSTGAAVIVVLHDRVDAWAMADRIVVIVDGRVAADASPRALLAQPPSPAVARFLGYDGELSDGAHVLLTRSADVSVDPLGKLSATVLRTIGTEDGLRLELLTPRGSVWSRYPGFELRVGDTVQLSIHGGVSFPK